MSKLAFISARLLIAILVLLIAVGIIFTGDGNRIVLIVLESAILAVLLFNKRIRGSRAAKHFVEYKESMIMAIGTFKAHKLRSFLTILGVLIGVSSIIGMVSLIEGLNGSIRNQIESLGSNVIYVSKYKPGVVMGNRGSSERNRPAIVFEDALAIKRYCPDVDGVAPQNYYRKPGGNIVKFRDNQARNPAFFGTLPDYEEVNNFYVARGRFINYNDEKYRAFVCVIGADMVDAIFPGIDPLEKEITINGDRFTVVGVMEKRETVMGSNENNFVLIPYNTFKKIHPEEKELWLSVKARSPAVLQDAIDQITDLMRRRHGLKYTQEDDFAVFTQESLLEIWKSLTQAVWLVMIVISSIGLLVGGVGVMNIMLVSVTERTREIGIRKAVGAKRSTILWQFLVEAATLSGIGGVMGIIVGILISQFIALVSPLPAVISIPWVIIGFCFSVAVAIIFGLYPAARASRLDPIEALRYE
ncbi:MAG: FtsX-like permease family protein [candidate division Zixibacteria bacterium]|jgi:putative ABC transport system permease protein|nr:FtsX-like permease family protein [candidate division Zixibacteria bacterium]